MSELGKVFVTGADGFIGSHLVEELVSRGEEVTALCIYNSLGSYGWLDRIAKNQPKNLNLTLGDIRDPFFMEQATKGHKTVLHLAALIAIPYSYVAPSSYVDTNIAGTLNVMQACLKNGVNRVVHTSTSEVYGTAEIVPIPETHPLKGQSPYSASKIGADKIAESFYCSFDLPVTTLRPFNTYGPRQSRRAIIPTVISQLIAGEKQIKLGNTTPTRDLNFVSDTVNAFIELASNKNEALLGGVFNAGSGREISIGDLVQLICKIMSTDAAIVEDQQRVRPSKSEVERLLADSSKIREATNWAPKYTLEEGLAATVAWAKENASGLASQGYSI